VKTWEWAVYLFSFAAMALFVVAFLYLLTSCAPSVYGVKLKACRELSGSCEAYVSCRKQAAAELGRAFEATCDGGAP